MAAGTGRRVSTAKRQRIIALILRGQSSDVDIASRVKVDRKTVAAIRTDPEVVAELAAIRASAVAEAKESLKQMLRESNYELLRIIRSKQTKPETRLQAIQYLHSLHGLKPDDTSVPTSVLDQLDGDDQLDTSTLVQRWPTKAADKK